MTYHTDCLPYNVLDDVFPWRKHVLTTVYIPNINQRRPVDNLSQKKIYFPNEENVLRVGI